MAPPPKSPRTGKGEEAGRGRKREPEDGVWGIPGGAQAKGQEPEAKRKATKTCTVHPKKVLQPNKERALCGSKHATWELSIERHDAVSSGNQKIPRRTVATVGMQTPSPPAREPWGPLRRRQTLPLLRAAHFQCCLSYRTRAWVFCRCKKNVASCFIRRAPGRLLHNIEKRTRRKL